jgi:signal transduction histidine kinase
MRSKVLQRFFRLEISRTTPGSGLGLSLVAAIAALHDARLELSDNEPGLRVTVLLRDRREGAALSEGHVKSDSGRSLWGTT